MGNGELEISTCDSHLEIYRIFRGASDKFTGRATAKFRQVWNFGDFLHAKQWFRNRLSNCRCTLLKDPSRVFWLHLLNGSDFACHSQPHRLYFDGNHKSTEQKQGTTGSDYTSPMSTNRSQHQEENLSRKMLGCDSHHEINIHESNSLHDPSRRYWTLCFSWWTSEISQQHLISLRKLICSFGFVPTRSKNGWKIQSAAGLGIFTPNRSHHR